MSTEGPSGSVLEHEFATNARSYFTTSYPYPIEKAAENDFRKKSYQGLPYTLTRRIKGFEAWESSTENMEEKKAVYIMNLSTNKPANSVDWPTNQKKDPPGHIWFMYSHTKKTSTGDFNKPRGLSPNEETTTSFGARLASLKSYRRGPIISYVSFAPSSNPVTPECFFIRSTNMFGVWQYAWDGLPLACDIAVQKQFRGGESFNPDANTSSKDRLRAVEFGFGGSWVVYTSEKIYFDGPMPLKLRKALQEGKDEEWTINKVSLNSRNPYEYVLAYNNGQIYYAMHKDYIPKFEEVVTEWGDKFRGVEVQRFPEALEDDVCHNNYDVNLLDSSFFKEQNHVRHPSVRSTEDSHNTAYGFLPISPYPRPSLASFSAEYLADRSTIRDITVADTDETWSRSETADSTSDIGKGNGKQQENQTPNLRPMSPKPGPSTVAPVSTNNRRVGTGLSRGDSSKEKFRHKLGRIISGKE